MRDSKRILSHFPEEVRQEIGFAVYEAERGRRHVAAKTMKGLEAVEVVSDFDGNAYRGIYTTKFKNCVFVLHCFEKKSKSGVKTPKLELDSIKQRLKDAKKIYDSF